MVTKNALILAITFAVAVAAGTYMAVQLSAQAGAFQAFDYSKAAVAEVRDSQGGVVLKGQFVTTDNDPNDFERTAMLSPAGKDTDAFGQAEVEVSGAGAQRRQEIEFYLRSLEPGRTFTLLIDGRNLATVTTNNLGNVEFETYVPIS